MDGWRTALLSARKRLGIGRAKLAERACVSPAIIRAYETGRRAPSRTTLDAILSALRVDRIEANAIREGAGFARPRTAFSDLPGYFFERDELARVVEDVPWPQFVTDDDFHIVAANSAARALWSIGDILSDDPEGLNLFWIFSDPKIAGRIENFDDLLRLLIGLFKGWRQHEASLPHPSNRFVEQVARFAPRNPDIMPRMAALWPTVDALPMKVRWTYEVVWRDARDRLLRFRALVSTASERDGLAFHDWAPLDGETWRALRSHEPGSATAGGSGHPRITLPATAPHHT